jgi:hypothetical protein
MVLFKANLSVASLGLLSKLFERNGSTLQKMDLVVSGIKMTVRSAEMARNLFFKNNEYLKVENEIPETMFSKLSSLNLNFS